TLTTPAPDATASNPDAEVLRLSFAFIAVHEQRERLWATSDGSNADELRVEAEGEPLGEQLGSLAREIANLPAVTLAGQHAKARVAFLLEAQTDEQQRANSMGITEDVTWSLVRDLVGRGDLPPAAAPDAELVRLCAEFTELERRSRALFEGPARIDDDNARTVAIEPIHDAQMPLVAAICELRATTTDGFRALAEAAVTWAPDLLEPIGASMSDELIVRLLSDLTGTE
ncbi:MAG: hypothetical protein M3Y41_04075, partial [Pseudomonadota bacterium]|nr:hypothetical protein [Pseudomonadota bacterium]